MDLQYPGNEDNSVQFPSSDIDRTSSESPPPSPNAFSQADIHARLSDLSPSNFDLDGNMEPIPADLDPSERDSDSSLGDEESTSTEFHPLINGMYHMLSMMLFYNF
jgi:hypothetical protein